MWEQLRAPPCTKSAIRECQELCRKRGKQLNPTLKMGTTQDGNQGKHRVTKRGPALSYPMFTLVTSEDIAGSYRRRRTLEDAEEEDAEEEEAAAILGETERQVRQLRVGARGRRTEEQPRDTEDTRGRHGREMTVCAIFGCKNRRHKGCGKHFFRFPMKDPERLIKWIEAVQRDNWKPSIHSKVCSDHFTERDYMIRPGAAFPYLRIDAVPTPLQPDQRTKKTKKRKYTKKAESETVEAIEIKTEDVEQEISSEYGDSYRMDTDTQTSAQVEETQIVVEMRVVKSEDESQDEEHGAVEKQGEEHRAAEMQGKKHGAVEGQGEEHEDVEMQSEEHGAVEKQGKEHGAVEKQGKEHEDVEMQSEEHGAVEMQGEEHGAVEKQGEEHRAAEMQGKKHGAEEGQGEEHEDVEMQSEEHGAVEMQGSENGAAEAQGEVHEAVEMQGKKLGAAEAQGEEHGAVEMQGEEHGVAEAQGEEHEAVEMKGEEHRAVEMQGKKLGAAEAQGEEHGAAEAQGEDHGAAEVHSKEHGAAEVQVADHRAAEGEHWAVEAQVKEHRAAEVQGEEHGAVEVQGEDQRVAETQGKEQGVAEMQVEKHRAGGGKEHGAAEAQGEEHGVVEAQGEEHGVVEAQGEEHGAAEVQGEEHRSTKAQDEEHGAAEAQQVEVQDIEQVVDSQHGKQMAKAQGKQPVESQAMEVQGEEETGDMHMGKAQRKQIMDVHTQGEKKVTEEQEGKHVGETRTKRRKEEIQDKEQVLVSPEKESVEGTEYEMLDVEGQGEKMNIEGQERPAECKRARTKQPARKPTVNGQGRKQRVGALAGSRLPDLTIVVNQTDRNFPSRPPCENAADYIPVDHSYYTAIIDKENEVPAPVTDPKVVKLRKKIKTLQKQVLRQGVKIKSLKKTLVNLQKNNMMERDAEQVVAEHCSGLTRVLFTQQLKNGCRRHSVTQYCSLMKEFALSLYCASPKAYKFCRLFLCLPHPVSLRNWKAAIDGNNGLSAEGSPSDNPASGA
ncbi:unnamed protein product, partial [Ranitomeya imitator]